MEAVEEAVVVVKEEEEVEATIVELVQDQDM